MNELELYAKVTLEKGGEWWNLEENEFGCICMTKEKFENNHNFYYTSPTYQVFDRNNKRVFTSMSRNNAYAYFRGLE